MGSFGSRGGLRFLGVIRKEKECVALSTDIPCQLSANLPTVKSVRVFPRVKSSKRAEQTHVTVTS